MTWWPAAARWRAIGAPITPSPMKATELIGPVLPVTRSRAFTAATMAAMMSSMIDHLVFASDDLPKASALVAELLGVAPTPGGSHVGNGTRNELLSLGGATYLEVIGPDAAQPAPDGPRPFGIDELTEPALVAWCVRPQRPLGEIVVGGPRCGHRLRRGQRNVSSPARRCVAGVGAHVAATRRPLRSGLAVHDRLGATRPIQATRCHRRFD